jgi:hypothetical protein
MLGHCLQGGYLPYHISNEKLYEPESLVYLKMS